MTAATNIHTIAAMCVCCTHFVAFDGSLASRDYVRQPPLREKKPATKSKIEE